MPSVSDFLIERLENAKVEHVFGLPGDYVLNFYDKLSKSEAINLINTTDESHAGFAADAYSRIKGIGCVCVTYSVGGLKVANATACAFAEKSPLIVICGSPGVKEREGGVLLHHMVRSFESQKEVFDSITCASVVLDNPATAGYEIDRVFEALHYYKQPIYIELPRDIADKPIGYDVKLGTPKSPESDPQNLNESLEEVISWIEDAENPIILAGVELARFGLGKELVRFAEKTNIPIASTLLSKSVISETHPLFLGVYVGNTSEKLVKKVVENSDCLLMFGVMLTDMTLGFMPSKFRKRRTVYCSIDSLKVKNHMYSDVVFKDFVGGLFKSEITKKSKPNIPKIKVKKYKSVKNNALTSTRIFEKIGSILDENMAIVCDIGNSLFGAIDLRVHHSNQFLSPAFYTSMGFAIPGVLGLGLAAPEYRAIAIVGDGAFQMSCTELSTCIDNNLNPIIIILNNGGYTTERFLLDGPFNDIRNWEYHKITEMLNGGDGVKIETEGDLDKAFEQALASEELFIINAIVDPKDISPALKRMAEGLSKRV
jgi:indolepyruvate decarboxylase